MKYKRIFDLEDSLCDFIYAQNYNSDWFDITLVNEVIKPMKENN